MPVGAAMAAVGWAVLAIVLVAPAALSARAQDAPAEKAAGASETAAPVILLTGFEPFGDGRPPNPSWEGIKPLGEKAWKGHRLVAKQLPVVWGEPVKQLDAWITEYRPVAVFSFGQGMAGSFALESKAANARAPIPDNRGERPPNVQIVDGGPPALSATVDCAQLSRSLADKGWPIRVSTHAGNYLCEEALYSLEYLKKTRKLQATVLFCHVPPLGTRVQNQDVTADYVTAFVKDVIASWAVAKPSPAVAAPCAEPPEAADPPDPPAPPQRSAEAREREVKELIVRYFRTWSAQDMNGYEECFLPEAIVQFIDPRGAVSSSTRADFVASQRDVHQNSPQRMTEVPESIDIRFEGNLARAVVFWKLTAGARTETGYDHFTLLKRDGNWLILNLAFYAARKVPAADSATPKASAPAVRPSAFRATDSARPGVVWKGEISSGGETLSSSFTVRE
jgi:pyroglutamyl-peptidase